MVDRFADVPSTMSAIILEHFHGAVTRIDPTATAVPHRDAGFNLLLPSEWVDPADTVKNIPWTKDTFAAVSEHLAARPLAQLPRRRPGRRRHPRSLRPQLRSAASRSSAATTPATSSTSTTTSCPEGRRRARAVACRSVRPGPAISGICQAYPDRVEVRGRDLCGDLMGRLSFTEYFHLLLTGEEPTERAALLPRPAAGGDRRARHDADQRRRPHDAGRRSRLAPGRGRCRHPRLRPGHPRHVGGVRRAARGGAGKGRRRRRAGRRHARDGAATSTRRAAGARASAIPCTGRSIPAPSGSWSWPTSAA